MHTHRESHLIRIEPLSKEELGKLIEQAFEVNGDRKKITQVSVLSVPPPSYVLNTSLINIRQHYETETPHRTRMEKMSCEFRLLGIETLDYFLKNPISIPPEILDLPGRFLFEGTVFTSNISSKECIIGVRVYEQAHTTIPSVRIEAVPIDEQQHTMSDFSVVVYRGNIA